VIDLTYDQARRVAQAGHTATHDEASALFSTSCAQERIFATPSSHRRCLVFRSSRRGQAVGPERAKATCGVFADFPVSVLSRAVDLLDALRERYPDKSAVVFATSAAQHARPPCPPKPPTALPSKTSSGHTMTFSTIIPSARRNRLETYAREAARHQRVHTMSRKRTAGQAVQAASSSERAACGNTALYLNASSSWALAMPLMQHSSTVTRQLATTP